MRPGEQSDIPLREYREAFSRSMLWYVPKITSGNRMAATDEEYKTILRGVNAYYGTYKVK
jgi:hypothetical protein